MVLKQARIDAVERATCGSVQVDTQVSQEHVHDNTWTRPNEAYRKCNYDGSLVNLSTPAKIGWSIRDSRGTYIEACHAVGNNVTSALEAELQAFLIALQHCWARGFTKVLWK